MTREPDEAVMITGDGNLLEVQGSIRYTISDPAKFVFDVVDPEKLLRNAAESVLREVVAGKRMADLLTGDRGAFQRTVQRLLQERCLAYPGGLGLRVEGLSLHDLHPPQEVVMAYHEVTRAMEKRDQSINEAQDTRIRMKRKQESDSLMTIRRAEADRFEKIRVAQARKVEFLARQAVRTRLPWRDEWSLIDNAADSIAAHRSLDEVKAEYRKRRLEMVSRQAALTDFRMYWDSLATTLSGRPKVMIDSDKVHGRRTLWLAPFDPPGVMPGLSTRPRRDREPTNSGEP
jgi:regulator of protease activity HflC (stomatin/prohibitin superfamily)